MIKGVVNSDEARIPLWVRGRSGQERQVQAVIDSGFTGALTLPPAVIASLGLRWRSLDRAILANGSTCVFQVFVAKIVWDGRVRTVLVAEADSDPLVGMRLLKGHELKIQVRAGGKVTVKRLPPS
jgi:clan AA aspartic protease